MSRKNPMVQTIRRQRGEGFGIPHREEPQRLKAGLPNGMKIQSDLHGDMQRLAEMTNPAEMRVTLMDITVVWDSGANKIFKL